MYMGKNSFKPIFNDAPASVLAMSGYIQTLCFHKKNYEKTRFIIVTSNCEHPREFISFRCQMQ